MGRAPPVRGQAQQWGHAGQQLQKRCWRHGKDSTLDPRLLGALVAGALSCPALGRQIVTKKKGKTGKLDLLCKATKGSTCLCTGLYKSLGVLSVVGGQCAAPSPKTGSSWQTKAEEPAEKAGLLSGRLGMAPLLLGQGCWGTS